MQKLLQSLRKKKQYVRQMIHINQGRHLPANIIPVIDEPVIQCDVSVVENTFFVDEFKQMIKMTNIRYKLLRINFDANTFIDCLETKSVHSFSFF